MAIASGVTTSFDSHESLKFHSESSCYIPRRVNLLMWSYYRERIRREQGARLGRIEPHTPQNLGKFGQNGSKPPC